MLAETALRPSTVEELSEALGGFGQGSQTLEVGGAFSKRTMGGEPDGCDAALSTSGLHRVLAYEPADLTISVEAGMPWADLRKLLDDNGQVLPLDPPFEAESTVGGVLACDLSGPRRRRYGTARDMVIGMSFVTIEGKRVRSGGMVVKNVTGLDMAKLMIGSLGTLGVIATANFKVFPKPPSSATFAFVGDDAQEVWALRREIIKSVLQPTALDLLNGAAVRLLGADSEAEYALLAEVHGNQAVVERYARDYQAMVQSRPVRFLPMEDDPASRVWAGVREFASRHLAEYPDGALLRVSVQPSNIPQLLACVEGPLALRAGTGVAYLGCAGIDEAAAQLAALRAKGFRALAEHAPVGRKSEVEAWADPGSDLALMKRVKHELDPKNQLNPGRLFGRL